MDSNIVRWYEKNGIEDSVVVSTRIRIARNLKDFPFPASLSLEGKEQILKLVHKVSDDFNKSQNEIKLDFLNLENIKNNQLISLAQKHLISPQFTENTKGKAILMARDESVCVMLNEEDHIRIQVLCTGLDLEKSLETALKIDQFFDNHLKYAFDENFGYLTSCPTNIGTGLRASVMLHLMGLEKTGLIAKLASTISQMGLTIRGTFGEGTKAQNYYYQVSNQITLGITEEQVIKNLKSITMQIIKKEYDAQKQFILNGNDADDKIHRMLGILKYAKKISYAEMCTIISDLRLGICQKFINLQPYVLNSMINTLSGACIEVEQGEKISPENRDMIRSLKIKQYLKEV